MKRKTKPMWREFLKGKWNPPNQSDARYKIRIKAKQMMRDLLLICQSPQLTEDDKARIFLQPERNLKESFWENVTVPLSNELLNARNFYLRKFSEDEFRRIRSFIITAHKTNFPYDLPRLTQDSAYRERKFQQLPNWDA